MASNAAELVATNIDGVTFSGHLSLRLNFVSYLCKLSVAGREKLVQKRLLCSALRCSALLTVIDQFPPSRPDRIDWPARSEKLADPQYARSNQIESPRIGSDNAMAT